MDNEPIELTIKDLLNIHRVWITALHADDNKSDVEITVMLQELRIGVTLQEVRDCLREWGFQTDPTLRIQRLLMEEMAASDGYRLDYSPQPPLALSTPRTTPLVTLNPTTPPHSTRQPTRSPSPSLSPPSSRKRNSSSSPSDRLGLTCHHGPTQSHEVQLPLKSMPDGPSQLEVYAKDEQSHEMLASNFPGGFGYKRAAESLAAGGSKRENRESSRHEADGRLRKRKGGVEDASGSRSGSGGGSRSCSRTLSRSNSVGDDEEKVKHRKMRDGGKDSGQGKRS